MGHTETDGTGMVTGSGSFDFTGLLGGDLPLTLTGQMGGATARPTGRVALSFSGSAMLDTGDLGAASDWG
jgi:hypothetical protein